MSNMDYNYKQAVYEDVKTYITENIDLSEYANRDDLSDYLNNELWVCDSVTGNLTGSYWCNTYKAEECLCHNWDLLQEALEELGCEEKNIIKKGAEWCDLAIRCYLLGEVIEEVLDDIYTD